MAITVPTVAARQFKLWGREIATPFLHYRCYISPRLPHTLLCCVSSQFATFFFFFWNKRCFTPPLTQEHTLAYFFFFFPETDPGIVKQRRDGSPVLFVWHLDKVRSNAEIGASPSPTPPSLLQPRSSQAYKLEEVQRNQAQLALLSRELLCNASKMER